MKRWKEQWDATKKHANPMKMTFNATRHQFKDSECGMYSMYFILRMLAGDEFQSFSRTKPPDSFMLDLRDWIFST
jgi:hypothetical protein